MNKKKYFLFAFVTVSFSVAAFLILAEIVLRFLPVSEGLRTRAVTAEQPLALFEPDDDLLWSRDWNFSIVNRQRVNRQGFANRYDYDAPAATPVLAVVGDSFIQASMVPFDETLHGRLEHEARETHGGRFRVYSFAAAGAPLSQYLAYARHAQDHYNVKGMIFTIIGNDFDESLPRYRYERRFHQFRDNGDGDYELAPPRGHADSTLRNLARHSALVRYLYLNVELSGVWRELRRLTARDADAQAFVGNTSSDMSDERLADSRDAVDAFLRLLPDYSGLPAQNVAFVVDSPRRELYGLERLDDLGDSYFKVMREYFMQQARERGYEVIDMAPEFFERHRKAGVVFEFPTDGHWNGEGHRAAFDSVVRSRVFGQVAAPAARHGGDTS